MTPTIISHWHNLIEGVEASPLGFYNSVEQAIERRVMLGRRKASMNLPSAVSASPATLIRRRRVVEDHQLSSLPGPQQVVPAAKTKDTWDKLAVPLRIQGSLALLRVEPSQAQLEESVSLFAQAKSLVPYDANAKNLATLAQVAARQFARPLGPRSLKVYVEILGLDPSNQDTLNNLVAVDELQLAALPHDSVSERRPLESRIDAVRRKQASSQRSKE